MGFTSSGSCSCFDVRTLAFMIGQWVQPGGGLPPSAMSGRNLMQKLCEESRTPFCTSQP
jgi:hypothetical protein